MDFNSKTSRILATVAIGLVLFRILNKLLPWIYKNIIGPRLFGPKINVRQMGSWAGKMLIKFESANYFQILILIISLLLPFYLKFS